MALSDLARDRNGAVIGRYRLVHSGGLSQTLTHGITFVSGVCEVNARGNERALARVVASLGPKLTVTRLDAVAALEANVAETVNELHKIAGTSPIAESCAAFETLADGTKREAAMPAHGWIAPASEPTSEDATTAPVDRCTLAASLHASGLSWAQVGDKMGVSKETARQLAKRHEAEAA